MDKVKVISVNDDEIEFLVRSSRNGYHQTKYNRMMNAWSCTCEWYGYRGGYCRHMKMAKGAFDEINSMVQGADCTVKSVRQDEAMARP